MFQNCQAFTPSHVTDLTFLLGLDLLPSDLLLPVYLSKFASPVSLCKIYFHRTCFPNICFHSICFRSFCFHSFCFHSFCFRITVSTLLCQHFCANTAGLTLLRQHFRVSISFSASPSQHFCFNIPPSTSPLSHFQTKSETLSEAPISEPTTHNALATIFYIEPLAFLAGSYLKTAFLLA